MRRVAGLVAALVLMGFGSVEAGGLDVRVGAFAPSADSNLFDDDAELYVRNGGDLKDGDWTGVLGGAEYSVGLGGPFELSFHLDGYSRTLHTSYRDFVGDAGREIRQSLKLDVVPLGASLRLVRPGRHVRFAPYVAVGADVVFWKYEEFGEFIDFIDPDHPILDDSFISEGATAGFHGVAGARFGVSDDISIVAEGRYLVAEDDMGDDFRGNKIDVGGLSATLGVHVRF